MENVLSKLLKDDEKSLLLDLCKEKVGFFKRLFSKCFSEDTVRRIHKSYNSIMSARLVEYNIHKKNTDSNIAELLNVIEELKKSHEKTITILKKDIQERNKNVTDTMGDIVKLRKEKQDISKELNNAIKTLQKKHASIVNKINTKHADEILELDKKYKNLKDKISMKNKDVKVSKSKKTKNNKPKKTGVRKLTCDEIKKARELYNTKEMSIDDLSKKYELSKSSISRAISGKTYKECN